MGCDIHIICEKRNRQTGKWMLVKDHFSQDDFDKEWTKKEKADVPFDWRSYGMFGFLAGVRNYSGTEVIAEPKGLPDDSEWLNSGEINETGLGAYVETNRSYAEDSDFHSHSWLTLAELLAFDYDKQFEDLRHAEYTGNGIDCSAVAEKGKGAMTTYRDFLGSWFFKHIEEMKLLGKPEDVRIVFWFDN